MVAQGGVGVLVCELPQSGFGLNEIGWVSVWQFRGGGFRLSGALQGSSSSWVVMAKGWGLQDELLSRALGRASRTLMGAPHCFSACSPVLSW